ncbi:MAG: hypothetical protein OEX03_13830 [Gammaproteobacteria bacterium]|nr:hypothetical protein [Gammaproteobacteria bacterium]
MKQMTHHNLFKLLPFLALLLALTACDRSYYLKPTENVMPIHQPGDSKLNCYELDSQIGDMHRQVSEMIPPDFYADGSNNAAIFTGTFLFTPAYLYTLQNEMINKPREYERIDAMVKRIQLLQRYKAQKHCFERQ